MSMCITRAIEMLIFFDGVIPLLGVCPKEGHLCQKYNGKGTLIMSFWIEAVSEYRDPSGVARTQTFSLTPHGAGISGTGVDREMEDPGHSHAREWWGVGNERLKLCFPRKLEHIGFN